MTVRRGLMLAWRDLAHDHGRLLASLAGVSFAAFLMFIEMGFLQGVYESQTRLIRLLNADLVIVNRMKDSLLPPQPFSRARLAQARAVDEIQAVYPLYLAEYDSRWKSLRDGGVHPILTIGLRPEDPALLVPGVLDRAADLKPADRVLIDARSRRFYGPIEEGVVAELSGRSVRLAGTFELGTNFRVDGTAIVSDADFLRYFPRPGPGRVRSGNVEIGLVRVAEDASVDVVRQALRRVLPSDVAVHTRREFADIVKRYWQRYQPIGMIFGLGMVVGFVIGVTICYQVLFTDVTDRHAQYATLKAMGYPDRFLMIVVLAKAALLGLLGAAAGMVMSGMVYSTLETVTGIQMSMTAGRAAGVAALAVVMCIVAALMAVRKVLRYDPAELY